MHNDQGTIWDQSRSAMRKFHFITFYVDLQEVNPLAGGLDIQGPGSNLERAT